MIAYKLFRKKKNGALTSLFINKTKELPIGEWMKFEDIPTKGYASRPGWHCTKEPVVHHLSSRGRVWCEVEIQGFSLVERPKSQGGVWYLADYMRIIREL